MSGNASWLAERNESFRRSLLQVAAFLELLGKTHTNKHSVQ
jgi:hypothetical protein